MPADTFSTTQLIWLVVVIVVAVLATLGCWMYCMSLDKARIIAYVEKGDARVVRIDWAPFGNGWLGDNNRIYEVVYHDGVGREHLALCKTSLFSGVYWTQDWVTNGRADDAENELRPSEEMEAVFDLKMTLRKAKTLEKQGKYREAIQQLELVAERAGAGHPNAALAHERIRQLQAKMQTAEAKARK